MTRFILRKLAQALLTLIVVMTVLFCLLRLTTDPARILAGAEATEQMVDMIRERYGLDRPPIVQYGDFLVGMATFDFGPSFIYQQPAFAMVGDVLPNSLRIIALALPTSILLALLLGSIAALRDGTGVANGTMLLAYVFQSVPYFVIAYGLILVVALQWRLLPATGAEGWSSAILPAVSILIPQIATLSRMVRGQLLDALEAPHVLAARAKGLAPAIVLFRHAFPTALPPILSWIGIQFGFAFGVLVVLEPIFNYSGLGGEFVKAVSGGDLPMVQAAAMVIASIVICSNLTMEIINRLIDPRLREAAK